MSNNFEDFENSVELTTAQGVARAQSKKHKTRYIGQSEQVNFEQLNQHKLPPDHITARSMVIIN